MYRLYLVEDDEAIRASLCRQLERWGYEVFPVRQFEDVLAEFEKLEPDLVLMDISLPFYSGFHWCAEIRRQSQVPILFLSSAGDDMNLVMAVNMGADDFIAKPFSTEVLVAKVQALLRRAYAFGHERNVLRVGEVVLDLGDASVSCGEKRKTLAKNEYNILRVLMEHKGQLVSREELIRQLWQSEDFIDDNTLTVNVTRLRRSLEEIGIEDLISTRKGMGYQIREDGE